MVPGYGQPGMGGWLQGMVWAPSMGGAAGVTTGQSMGLSPVFACVRLLSEAIATLPLQTFTRSGGIRKPYYPVPAYLLFNPPLQSRITYLSQVMLSLLTDGNAFVATVRDAMGVPLMLVPLDPGQVTVDRVKGRIVFRAAGEEFDESEILHIPGMMMPGDVRGVSPLRAARECIESGLRSQEFFQNTMRNHAVPPAVIEIPGGGGDPAAERDRARRVADHWHQSHGGGNAGRIGVLTNGAKLNTVAINPADLEWLESRKFTVSEVARFYGVPPHLIADASNSTSWGSGLQEQNEAFKQLSLGPWIERVEDAHTRLLTTHGLGDVFIKLNVDARLRASTMQRYEAYAAAIENGFMTVNEVRKLEDMPPVAWGDEPFIAAKKVMPERVPIEQNPPVAPTPATGGKP